MQLPWWCVCVDCVGRVGAAGRLSAGESGAELEIDHEVGCDSFQLCVELGNIAIGGKLEAGLGAEEAFAGHGGAFAGGFEFFHVDAITGQSAADLLDDSRPVLADELEGGGGGGWCGWGVGVVVEGDGDA